MSARPNILWITCHDINPDLGCYAGAWPGAEYAITPNLDRLATEGVRYEQAFSVAPVCAPSRSASITGMYPTAIGTMHMRSRAVPPPEVRCLPQYLRSAGYYCTNNSFTDYNFAVPVTVWDENSPTAHWRDRPDPDQPFFAAFHSLVTHQSQIYVGEDTYRRNTAALTPEQRHDPASAPLPPYYPDTEVMRRAFAQYSDNITAMDYWAADLLAQLERDGLAENTIVVFWSDHGRGMPRAKLWPYEAGLHVPLLIRWPGKIDPGTVCDEPVGLIDLAPTMLAAAGLEPPPHMHAEPLFDEQGKLLTAGREYAYGHADRMETAEDTIRTVRDARYRYIRHYHPDRPYFQYQEWARDYSAFRELQRFKQMETWIRSFGGVPDLLTDAQRQFLAPCKPAEELYDHAVDPHEINNLAADPAYAETLARLRRALDDWQETHGDLGLLPEEELTERWRPGGVTPRTDPPDVTVADGQVVATCETPGAAIAWTTDPPSSQRPTLSPHDAASFLAADEWPPLTGDAWYDVHVTMVGAPPLEGRWWRLYTGAFVPPEGAPVWLRACRLGYLDSADIRLDPAPSG